MKQAITPPKFSLSRNKWANYIIPWGRVWLNVLLYGIVEEEGSEQAPDPRYRSLLGQNSEENSGEAGQRHQTV